MKYVIYSPASKAIVRQQQVTDDARESNFLPPDGEYEAVITHPTEDKAALIILVTEGIYYNDEPKRSYNYGIFFTSQEKAKAVEILPEDWNYVGV